jgi:three-Cys-motif partner protein
VAVPKGVVWDRDPHTEAKHKLLRLYLDAYFPIMASKWTSTGITFVDAFAGPGEYRDGSSGSPIIALAAARRLDVYKHPTDINFVFVEKDKPRFDHLESMLRDEERPPRVFITAVQGACESVLLPELDRLNLWDGPMFVNFDGWGVDTPHELIQRVGRGKAPEVLVTFHSQWLTRFAEKENVAAGDRVFGDQEWRTVSDLPTPSEKKRFLVDEYRGHLTEWSFPYHLTFELVDDGGHSLLLVFGTSNERGVEKMKDAMWRVDNITGSRFRDPRDPNQLAFDLQNNSPNLHLLRQQIMEQLDSGPRTLADLQRFTLLETVFKKAHARKAVDDLESQRKVLCQHARAHEKFTVQRAPDSLF